MPNMPNLPDTPNILSNLGIQSNGAFLYQQYLIEIDILGGESIFIPIGLGQTYPIIWDSLKNTWKINHRKQEQ
jgi:hypothetical protein